MSGLLNNISQFSKRLMSQGLMSRGARDQQSLTRPPSPDREPLLEDRAPPTEPPYGRPPLYTSPSLHTSPSLSVEVQVGESADEPSHEPHDEERGFGGTLDGVEHSASAPRSRASAQRSSRAHRRDRHEPIFREGAPLSARVEMSSEGVQDWHVVVPAYGDKEAPQTQLHLPVYQPSSPPLSVETITPPPSMPPHAPIEDLQVELNAQGGRRARRQAPSVELERPTLSLFRVTDQLELPRFSLERALSPLHVPSLQEMALKLKLWIEHRLDSIYLRSTEVGLAELSAEELDEIKGAWQMYFELRPQDAYTKLEYGWFLLDFYGKPSAQEHFDAQLESSHEPDLFLFALSKLSFSTGDAVGADEYMRPLYERRPEDMKVLQLKLEIEQSLGRADEAFATGRLLHRRQLELEGRLEGQVEEREGQRMSQGEGQREGYWGSYDGH